MRLSLGLLLCCAVKLSAQTDVLVFSRMGGWNTPTFHFLDVIRIRGRLILPDIGYVDFGRSDYRELYGGGVVAYPGKQFHVDPGMLFRPCFRHGREWSFIPTAVDVADMVHSQ